MVYICMLLGWMISKGFVIVWVILVELGGSNWVFFEIVVLFVFIFNVFSVMIVLGWIKIFW